MSLPVADMGNSSGNISTEEISPPNITAGARLMRFLDLRKRMRFIADAKGTARAISTPTRPSPDNPSLNIHHMPMAAIAMHNQVTRGICIPKISLANTAAISGDRLIVNKVLATVVIMSATIKHVNMTHQNKPDNHPAHPIAIIWRNGFSRE